MLLLTFATAVSTAFLGWRVWQHIRFAQFIATTHTTTIQAAIPGQIEVKGRVSIPDDGLLLSPATSTPCAWYRYQVQDRQQDGVSVGWLTVRDEQAFGTCLVEDDTGAVEVDLRAAELNLSAQKHRHFGMVRQSRRYYETRLDPGDEIYVLGSLRVRDGQPPRITRDEGVLLVSTRPQTRLIAEHRFHAALHASGVVAVWIALWLAVSG